MIGKTILGYEIIEELGSGGFGTVYKAVKSNQAGTYTRALKHIALPSRRQYVDVLNSMGGDYTKADDYFSRVLDDIVNEIKILSRLTEEGVRNVVWYYENHIEEDSSPKKYDIYILMEYLTALPDYMAQKVMTVRDIIRLGKEVASALIVCHENHIIHRDVKEDNIFVTEKGVFKLGDFGVSKKLKDRALAESVKGTPNYIAPEVYLNKEKYGDTVDVYSLGIVLYKLLNHNRFPFLPQYPQAYSSYDEDLAFEKRMKGELPILPDDVCEQVGKVILKALMKKDERYHSAKEFYDALSDVEKTIDEKELERAVAVGGSVLSQSMHSTSFAFGASDTNGDLTVGIFANAGEIKENFAYGTSNTNGDLTVGIFANAGEINEKPENAFIPDAVEKSADSPERKSEETYRETEMPVSDGAQKDSLKPKTETKSADIQQDISFQTQILNEQYGHLAREPKASKSEKINLRWIAYVMPVVFIAIYFFIYKVILPMKYDQAISIVGWAFQNPKELLENLKSSEKVFATVNGIIAWKVLFYLLFAGFISSLYFLGRELQFGKKEYSKNAQTTGKEAVRLAMELMEEIKVLNAPEMEKVLRALKDVSDRMRNGTEFGRGDDGVIRCETEIYEILMDIKEKTRSGTYDEKTKEEILAGCRQVMSKLRMREQLTKK